MGRIVAKDVKAAAVTGTVTAEVTTASPAKVGTVAPGIELGSVVHFTTMQGAVSRIMVESLTVPTFRVGYTITTDALDALYRKIKFKGVTMTELLAKATALALVKHPVVNSSCRDGKSFTYDSSINIAVAVAIDGGLITLVLQDADKVPSLFLTLGCLVRTDLMPFCHLEREQSWQWSFLSNCCGYQGWLNWHEEPDAGKCYSRSPCHLWS
ncbi:hypothetical protein SLE2022_237860 [Rubroshorea leprosula]